MKTIDPTALLGAHLSIAGGYEKALHRGEELKCTTVQIFTASNRQWSYKLCEQHKVEKYLQYKKITPIKTVISHASYLINLASVKADLVTKSIKALTAETQRCAQLEIPYIVLHPGSALHLTEKEAIHNIAKNLTTVLQNSPENVTILLETMAGQGTTVGSTFEQLAAIRHALPMPHQVGICLDTCHVFAAGYSFDTQSSYNEMWHDFDNILGLETLKVIHLNDSQHSRGSRLDRHEHIGKGKIETKSFELIMNDERLAHIPKILETPKGSQNEKDEENLKTLRNMIS